MSVLKSEPAVTHGVLASVVSALLALGASFGLHLSADQQAAVVTVVAVLAPLVAGFITRGKVTPVSTQIEGD
jgi:hypothetical protein